jgi:hypothetical protein
MSNKDATGKNRAGRVQAQFTRGTKSTIRAHARVIANAPPGEFHISERLNNDPAGDGLTYYEMDVEHARSLSAKGIFQRIRRVEFENYSNPSVVIWRCAQKYRRCAARIVEARGSFIPECEHTGLRNLRGGEFTCTTDDCDVEVSRAEVQR